MIKVSVIIPVYNTEKYLPRCLDSVCNQTLQDIEIICINDCSKDNSLTVLRDYAERDSRVRIIDLHEGKGAGGARNCGIEAAGGEYVGFVDSDDFIDLDFYEKLYKKGIETGADIVKSNLKNVGWNKTSSGRYYNLKDVRENKLKLNHVPTTIIKRKLLVNNNIRYPEDLTCAEDSVFEVYVSSAANKIEIAEEVYYYYVYRDKSLNHVKVIALDKVKEVEKSILKVIDLYNSLNIDEKTYTGGIIDRAKYLSFFIKDKSPSDEILEYVKQAEKNIFSKLKYPELIKNIEMQRRVNLAWGMKRKEVQSQRTPKFIISLTSFPQRMRDIHICLHSLMLQTLKPDEIILYLGQEQFPNRENDLPREVLSLREVGLTIKFTKDIKSYKKLIPALAEYPDDVIITADDDIFYPKDWFKKLYNAHLEDKQNILCHRAHKVKFDGDSIALYKYWDKMIDDNSTSYFNFATGSGGILYPPNSLYKDILKEELFVKLAPNADDIWFWAMAILNRKKIKVINEPIKQVQPVNYDRESSLNGEFTLYQANIVGNDIQLKNVISYYPEIVQVLKSEINKEAEKCQAAV